MAGDPCPRCDRVACPWMPYEAMDYIDYDAAVAEDTGAEWDARFDCDSHRIDWRAEALHLRTALATAERERDEAREEIAKLQGDRCDVCDEDGLIYVQGTSSAGGDLTPDDEPQACPLCEGTRSGYASRITRERDTALASLASTRAELEAAARELERWRHGAPIEGDYVCPNALRADNAEAESEAMRGVVEAAEFQRDHAAIRDNHRHGDPGASEKGEAWIRSTEDLERAVDAFRSRAKETTKP